MTNSNWKGSKFYWEERYKNGGHSGAGSQRTLAQFKADFLNMFVDVNQISSVLEFGCGDGQQLSLFHFPHYVGVDISCLVIDRMKETFNNSANHTFFYSDEIANVNQCDLSISLDVVYHLVEDDVFEKYMRDLFMYSTKFAIVYSSDHDGNWGAAHVRHRNVTRYVQQRHPEWRLVGKIMNQYPWNSERPNDTSFADFMIFVNREHDGAFLIPSPKVK